MKIDGKVHCFFEQSGTFRDEFRKLGIPAEGYDIQNNYGRTDHVMDLFAEIELAWNGKQSIFDEITQDDLVIAFFPCTYFCENNQLAMSFAHLNYRKLSKVGAIGKIIERHENRHRYFSLLCKLFGICYDRGLRMILENPYSPNSYLIYNFLIPPTCIDKNRMLRGDYFEKPTAYWFVNCERTNGISLQMDKKKKKIAHCKKSNKRGLCSDERSAISSDYARNFICDFILGVEQPHSLRSLF